MRTVVFTRKRNEFVPGIDETKDEFEDADDVVMAQGASNAIPDFIDTLGGIRKKKTEESAFSP